MSESKEGPGTPHKDGAGHSKAESEPPRKDAADQSEWDSGTPTRVGAVHLSPKKQAKILAEELMAEAAKDDGLLAREPSLAASEGAAGLQPSRSMQSRIIEHAQSVRSQVVTPSSMRSFDSVQMPRQTTADSFTSEDDGGGSLKRGKALHVKKTTGVAAKPPTDGSGLPPTPTVKLHIWIHWVFSLVLLGTIFVRVNAVTLVYLTLFVLLCATSTAKYVTCVHTSP